MEDDDSLRNSMGERARRRRRKSAEFGFWGFMAILVVASNGIGKVFALPMAQADTTTPATSPTTTTLIKTATPGPILNPTINTVSGSSTSSVKSSTTTSVPGTIVTDSPLVRSKLSSISPFSLASNASYSGSALSGSFSVMASSTSQSSTILPSPTTNDDNSNNTNGSDENTYNSLVNFYFLILAAFIGFAVLGWWIWRRRRKGKTTRDQRRGLEALRRDLELGRLRRGFLGVVGRGGNNTPTTNEDLPP
jgi:uncharacterized iron-regulated membrane protein